MLGRKQEKGLIMSKFPIISNHSNAFLSKKLNILETNFAQPMHFINNALHCLVKQVIVQVISFKKIAHCFQKQPETQPKTHLELQQLVKNWHLINPVFDHACQDLQNFIFWLKC